MKEKFQVWLDKAEYDIDTAKAMLDTGRYNYVAFMLQQTIEKVLKAIYVKKFNEVPIKTHNLVFLAKKVGIEIDEETEDFLESLFIDYLTVRYPDVGEYNITKDDAEKLYQKSMEVFLWLKKLIKS